MLVDKVDYIDDFTIYANGRVGKSRPIRSIKIASNSDIIDIVSEYREDALTFLKKNKEVREIYLEIISENKLQNITGFIKHHNLPILFNTIRIRDGATVIGELYIEVIYVKEYKNDE